MHKNGESDSRQLEEVEESRQVSESSRKSDVQDGTAEKRRWAKVDVHADSNWASDPERKSTSGGMMMINGTFAKHWSRTQATRALSTAVHKLSITQLSQV